MKSRESGSRALRSLKPTVVVELGGERVGSLGEIADRDHAPAGQRRTPPGPNAFHLIDIVDYAQAPSANPHPRPLKS